jgi:predicted negative regulator of RcsB-dependent stress response
LRRALKQIFHFIQQPDFNLAFWALARKTSRSFMQAQDATTLWLLKFWPWFEANTRRILYAAVFVAIAVFVISFYSWRQSQKEIEAGKVFTQALISSNGSQFTDACLKVAADYSGTRAGQRALLQAAASLFTSGKYADAQTQFQKFLDAYPDNSFTPQATLGVATSLDAQGKMDLAAPAYQKAASQTSDASVVLAAKFALAQMSERQGQISVAQKLYEEVARAFPNSSMGSEAGLRATELKSKSPAIAPPFQAAPAAAPFNLSH